jgi:hypothetical protein
LGDDAGQRPDRDGQGESEGVGSVRDGPVRDGEGVGPVRDGEGVGEDGAGVGEGSSVLPVHAPCLKSDVAWAA